MRSQLDVSERRACSVVGQPRATHRRHLKTPDDEAALTAAIVRLATRYGRYGYRRIREMLVAEGWRVNVKRVYRIWRREGLKVPSKQSKRGRLWLNDGSCVRLRPQRPNHVWSYDFVQDRTQDGRAFRMLVVLDELVGRASGQTIDANQGAIPLSVHWIRQFKQWRSGMKVKDAMHVGAFWVGPDTSVTEIAKLMHKNEIGAVPIGENDRLIGMVTDRDIVCKGLAKDNFDVRRATARDVMTSGIHCCKEDDDLAKAAQHMEKLKVRRLPVINKDKRMVGVLSRHDTARAQAQN